VTTLPYGMFEANDPRGDLSGALVAALAAVAQGKVDHRLKAGHEFELSH